MSGNKTDRVNTNELVVEKSTCLNKNVYIKQKGGCGGLKVDAPSEFSKPIQAIEINAPPNSGGITIEGVNIDNGVITGGGGGGGSKWHFSSSGLINLSGLPNSVPEVAIPNIFGGYFPIDINNIGGILEMYAHHFTGPTNVPYTVAVSGSATGAADFRITEIPLANLNDTPAPIAAANRILDAPVTLVGPNFIQEFTVTPTVTNSIWFYHKTGSTFQLLSMSVTED